jgi:hypothetical protein
MLAAVASTVKFPVLRDVEFCREMRHQVLPWLG